MGVITLENEFPVAVAPAKLFKAYCLDTDTLLPKILPEHIKSSEIVEGNGGPGTIRKITFTEGKELSYAKQKIEAIDEENLTYSFSLIEANVWKDAVEKHPANQQNLSPFSISCDLLKFQVIMGVITLENEFAVAVAPAKVFRAYCLEIDTLLPKILPEHIKSCEIIEGNGGPGTIRKITFVEGKELSYAKQKIEAIDEENLTYSFSLIEANVWKDAVEKVTYEHKFVPTPEGGSVCKRTSTYHIKGDAEINKDQINDVYGKKTAGLFKVIEAYFLANPEA
ncbi:hypothetical protein SADUNF_Sadunf11G0012400 [Salix dunnii]|uniref:Bet v I/Major latex protein domain-containing protein n=2 Tax=Salix dunnii TaxID=1413687 RepID=A0A835JN10_9ROSI|nr:hypothetical protein SADUNF_Sadunf11G0012400 [Salix dunnii]